MRSNIASKQLSNDNIHHLLKSSNTTRLSNALARNIVLKQVLDLMRAIFDEVERIDSRIMVTIELSGSMREGTKVELPDEFDFLCFLDSFESICDIEESETSDYVQCRLRDGNSCSKYRSFFDENNLLLVNRLTSVIYNCIRKSMSKQSIWETAPGFMEDENTKQDFGVHHNLTGIQCLTFLYSDTWYKNLPVSCDIVPAIRKPNWRPSSVKKKGGLITEDILKNGFLIITKPLKNETLCGETINVLTKMKTSVYLAECAVLHALPPVILQSYKLAKIMLKQKNLYPGLFDTPLEEGKLFNI